MGDLHSQAVGSTVFLPDHAREFKQESSSTIFLFLYHSIEEARMITHSNKFVLRRVNWPCSDSYVQYVHMCTNTSRILLYNVYTRTPFINFPSYVPYAETHDVSIQFR